MDIIKEASGDSLTFKLIGRLDTITSPSLEKEIDDNLSSVKSLIFDFEKLDYLSSAGLRLILKAQKLMNARGGMMKVKNANDDIMGVFDMTGFSSIITVEN